MFITLGSICGISIVTYLLIAFDRTYVSIEAALKYFSLSAFVTGVMAFGYIVILQYNIFINYLYLLNSSANDIYDPQVLEIIYIISIFLFLTGFFFKLSIFPCYI
jgi:NADH:ubiquinone oxidoreductase subunit 2 (subunit N)